MKESYVELQEKRFQGGEIQEEVQEGGWVRAWGREEVEVRQGKGDAEIQPKAGRVAATVVALPSGRSCADAARDLLRLLH